MCKEYRNKLSKRKKKINNNTQNKFKIKQKYQFKSHFYDLINAHIYI